jgi:tetratricopeptide (TPR) repeat protein
MSWVTITILGRKAVSDNKSTANLKRSQLAIGLCVIVISFGFSNFGQAETKKSKPKGSTTAAQAKPRTVGDLLKGIERRSEKVNFTKSKSALPNTKLGPAPTKVNLREVKPPSSNRLYYEEGTDEAQLEQVTDEGINQLFNLTKRYSKSTKRGELWLRLAEMYVEKSRLIEFRLINDHDAKMQSYQDGKLKKRPKLDLSPAMAYNKKAVQLYEWFLRDFPTDPKVDQALFFLGYNYFEMNEAKKGQEYYVRLTKEFPNSLYVSESNFALGEYHFESERWKESLVYYERVAEQKSSRLYTFALYKMAWSYYKLNQSKKGLNYIEQVVFEGRKSKGQKDASIGGVSRIRLATEAIKDLIVFFAEAGDYKTSRAYFEEVVGQKSAAANLARLAQFYADTGNREAARFVFSDLIDQEPNSLRAHDYQYAIVKMYGSSGGAQGFRAELFNWIEQYGPGSSWQRVNSGEKEALRKANELMEGLLRNHVLLQHQTAQNSRTKSSQQSARSGYELYFNTFKGLAKNDEMHFFYGELLFDMDDFALAAEHYAWVIENTPDSPYFQKALLNSLLAYEKRLPNENKIKELVGTSTEPIEFPPAVSAFEKVAFKFMERAPKSESVVAVRYRLGALYYLFNQFDKAMPLLQEIVKKHPKTEYAKHAANHMLDIFNLKKDYAGLQSAANDILAIPELAKSGVGEQIRDIKLKTDFKLAKELEDKKDFAGSARAYEDFASRNRASDLSPAALFNAAVNYERAGDLVKAIAMYSAVSGFKGKPTQTLVTKSNKFLPALYEKTGQYARAAQLFEAYARQNPKDALAEEYHYNAAVIFDGMNSYASAIKNYEDYFAKARGKDRIESLFLVAKIYERSGQTAKAIAQYEKYVNSGSSNAAGVIEAHFTIAKLHEVAGRKPVADKWYTKTVLLQRRLAQSTKAVGASYAAEAKFKLVYKTYEELVAIRIPASPAKQGEAVQKKLALINRLKDQLKAVIAYDDAYQVVAALSLQGQALQHLYSAIAASPRPPGLKPEELKQYEAGIQGIASPFRDQALEVYRTAIARGHDLQGYNESLLVALKNASVLSGKPDPTLGTVVIETKVPDGMEL